VLDADEDEAVLVVDDRAAGLGVARHGEELLDLAAVRALEGDAVEGVVEADGAGLAVRRDPQRGRGPEGDEKTNVR
jgi:hypothetical protein